MWLILTIFIHICTCFSYAPKRSSSENEWIGWLRWMKAAFERGTINEIWKNIEVEKWFDPHLRNLLIGNY
jgi:hypothetical protein